MTGRQFEILACLRQASETSTTDMQSACFLYGAYCRPPLLRAVSAAADPVARGDSRLDSGDIKDVSGGGSLTSSARSNASVAPLRSVL